MPRFSEVHYQSLEAHSALSKLTRIINKRRRNSKPAPQEYPLNIYNIRRCLEAVEQSLGALKEESSTLSYESGTVPLAPLVEASEHLAAAIAALPAEMPPIGPEG